MLRRRNDPEIPAGRVCACRWSTSCSGSSRARRPAGRRRAQTPARAGPHHLVRPAAGPDRGSPSPGRAPALQRRRLGIDLPLCRRLGIPTILSMVHGDVREEIDVLDREASDAPEFFPIYLGDGAARPRGARLAAPAAAARHRAGGSASSCPRTTSPSASWATGLPPEKIRVVPYAADSRRFRPVGGEAARPGLHVPLRRGDHPAQGDQVPARGLGPGPPARAGRSSCSGRCPGDPGPLSSLLDQVELLGRVGARGDAGPDGGGRRLRVPVALRGLRRGHVRGAGLRPAERRLARRRLGRPGRDRAASWSTRATCPRWRDGWSSSASRPSSAPGCPRRHGPARWSSTGLATTAPSLDAVNTLIGPSGPERAVATPAPPFAFMRQPPVEISSLVTGPGVEVG